MLSPKIKATLSSPMNFSPIMNASARLFGFSWISYSKGIPKSEQSPKDFYIIAISWC